MSGRCLFVWCLLSCSVLATQGTDSEMLDGYAAIVNGDVITVGDVMEAIAPVSIKLRRLYAGKPELLEQKIANAYDKALDSLVEHRLILQEFERQEIPLSDRAVDQQLNEILRERFGNDRGRLLDTLASQNLTMDEWRERMREQLIVSVMLRREVHSRVRIAPKTVREAYESNTAQFNMPSLVKLSVIFVRAGATDQERAAQRERAEAARARLLAGEAFDQVAREVSEGPAAGKSGRLGWIDPQRLDPAVAEGLLSLEAGGVSEVVEAGDGLYVLGVEDRKEPRTMPFEEARDKIEKALRKKLYDALYERWIGRLKAKSYVKEFR